MARGWESKSVEEQIANATPKTSARANEVSMSEEERRRAFEKRAVIERQKQALNLQRENILSQRTSNPARRAALESALSEIETQLASLE
jgi:chromosome segregation ATPase